MHVTQTYLGSYGESGLFVYYLFEDYSDKQQQLTSALQNALDDLGADFMEGVDLFRPNPRNAGSIASEIRAMPALWEHCQSRLPGFLVAYKPLVQIDFRRDEVLFFSILDLTEPEALDVVKKIREMTVDNIRANFRTDEPIVEHKGILRRIYDATDVKPGFAGFSIDLKKLIKRG